MRLLETRSVAGNALTSQHGAPHAQQLTVLLQPRQDACGCFKGFLLPLPGQGEGWGEGRSPCQYIPYHLCLLP